MRSSQENQNVLFNVMKMPVGTADKARRFLAYIQQFPELSRITDVQKKIHAARSIAGLTGLELKPGLRSLQDELMQIDGPITFKSVLKLLPNENDASMRVCLSRLVAMGHMERLAYGVYWNRKGERPTDFEIIIAKTGTTPFEKVAKMTGQEVLMKLHAKLSPAMFKRVGEVL